jgi:hypothetical protein
MEIYFKKWLNLVQLRVDAKLPFASIGVAR